MENEDIRNDLVNMFFYHESCIKDLREQIHEYEKDILGMQKKNKVLIAASNMLKYMEENAISPPGAHLEDQ